MATTTVTTDTMTCQVCGRAIKAGNGLIAHHGYKRPYEGWQTASCEGARYVPYEVSCERLREVASQLFDFIVAQEKGLAAFLANPPQTLTVMVRATSWSKPVEHVYEKPEDFQQGGYVMNRPRTYENAFATRTSDWRRVIRLAKGDLDSMKRRLDEWRKTA